jgi:hypothetical protein
LASERNPFGERVEDDERVPDGDHGTTTRKISAINGTATSAAMRATRHRRCRFGRVNFETLAASER